MKDLIVDTLLDSLKLLPFLLATFVLLEWLEKKMQGKSRDKIARAGKWGPFWGSLAGAVPQCGFSVSATNLYAARVISAGTLVAVYLSTSDEMLPIFLSNGVSFKIIGGILLLKIVLGMLFGFLIDLLPCWKARKPAGDISDFCQREHCDCEEGILRSAWRHTVRIALFILVISFALNTALFYAGDGMFRRLLLSHSVLGPMLASLVGLIPNCGASVAIAQCYLQGMLSFGSAMAGLLTGSGIGLLVLFRINRPLRDNIWLTMIVYAIGVCCGIVMNGMGVTI